MLTHWFDNLARTVGRSVLFGAPYEPRRPAGHPPKPRSVREITSGPCLMRVSGQLVTHGFSTQASSVDGALLSYDLISTRDFEHGTMSSVARITRNAEVVLEAQTHSASKGQSTVRIQVKTGADDMKQVVVSITPESVDAQIDGAPFAISRDALRGDRQRKIAGLKRDANDAGGYASADTEGLGPRWDLDERFLGQFKALAHRVERDMPGCLLFPETMDVQEANSSFPDCQNCMDDCDQKRDWCVAKAIAGCVGPWWPVCVAIEGAQCLSNLEDCQDACGDGGPCCPQRCQRGVYSECCPHGQTCCGARCCPGGESCADPGRDLCCSFGSGPPCGDHCCSPGFKCANVYHGLCCPQDAGDYCPDQWGTQRCCPPGQVCADREIGLCCPSNHGPVCSGKCCAPRQICRFGTCCDPKQVCGSGENAVCCVGVCRDGVCCHAPSHMCGDVCCPPFNACCNSTCCGAFDVCTDHGCCPRESLCGRVCCPAGEFCADAANSVCKPCPTDHLACQMIGRDGKLFSMCCPRGTTCCDGKCCGPGQVCCPVFDRFECNDPIECLR
jgi:hypothetical protein